MLPVGLRKRKKSKSSRTKQFLWLSRAPPSNLMLGRGRVSLEMWTLETFLVVDIWRLELTRPLLRPPRPRPPNPKMWRHTWMTKLWTWSFQLSRLKLLLLLLVDLIARLILQLLLRLLLPWCWTKAMHFLCWIFFFFFKRKFLTLPRPSPCQVMTNFYVAS